MVKEKYPDLNFSDINFSNMKGHDSINPPKPIQAAPVQPAEEDETQTVEGVVETQTVVQAEIVEWENNVENIVLVPSDWIKHYFI